MLSGRTYRKRCNGSIPSLSSNNALRISALAIIVMTLASHLGVAGDTKAAWAPVSGRLMTPWAAQVSPTNALPEYPRPQMVRREWFNLNGLWEFAVSRKE